VVETALHDKDISPRTPDRSMPIRAFSMHPASVAASFKRGITMESSIPSVTLVV
jgi:hypothetical protein